MQTAPNPLRAPKPSRKESLFHGRFYFTNDNGRLAGDIGTHIFLTTEYLWLTAELAIPLHLIESVEIVKKGRLPPRRFIVILYRNPITNRPEQVCLCTFDIIGIGIYRLEPLEELRRLIDENRGVGGKLVPAVVVSTEAHALAEGTVPDSCEVCGAKPAFYVSYVFLMSAIFFSHRSAAKRRLHCRKHNALHGMGYYLLTMLTGWIGIGVFAYPFVVFASGRNLAPSLGKASYVLGVLPILAVAGLIALWIW